MGNYWSNDDGRLAAMESRILYLEKQLRTTTIHDIIRDEYDHVSPIHTDGTKPTTETKKVLPSFHHELKARLERRRKFIDMDL